MTTLFPDEPKEKPKIKIKVKPLSINSGFPLPQQS